MIISEDRFNGICSQPRTISTIQVLDVVILISENEKEFNYVKCRPFGIPSTVNFPIEYLDAHVNLIETVYGHFSGKMDMPHDR